jgi:branched-chain amino acid aminotransferase
MTLAHPPTGSVAATSTQRKPPGGQLLVWADGKLVPKAEAVVNVFDHGLLYGDGVFEGIRVYGGKIFESDAHIDRLYESAKAIRMTIPLPKQAWVDAIHETARANGFVDCYVRALVTRGVGPLGISPVKCATPSCFVICDSLDLYPRELYEKGMSVITCSVTRNHPNALSGRIKSLNYLNNILGKLEAIDAGVPDAIMLNPDGHVAEATAANLFIVRKGVLATPSIECGLLEGVTRNVILRIARDLGLPTEERVVPRFDLYVAEECFLTGTGAEVMPITQIDRRPVGDGKVGPVTQRLLEGFRRATRGG